MLQNWDKIKVYDLTEYKHSHTTLADLRAIAKLNSSPTGPKWRQRHVFMTSNMSALTSTVHCT